MHSTLEDIISEFMVQIKFFEASSLGYLEGVNEFLEGVDKKNVINVSITT
jgi:hypothetical protein